MKTSFFLISLTLLLMPAMALAEPSVAPLSQVAATQANVSVQNPLTVNSFCGLLKTLFSALLQLFIPVAVVFLILAGAKYVFAMGNPGALIKAHENIKWTLIGIALFLGAWLIVMAIQATLQQLGVTLLSCS